jgi:hypothetical protein
MSRSAYDNTGAEYNVNLILKDDTTLDLEKYKAYSPLYLPLVDSLFLSSPHLNLGFRTAFAVAYGLSFASITATIMHTILYLRKSLRIRSRGALAERPDIHARLMKQYPEGTKIWNCGGRDTFLTD